MKTRPPRSVRADVAIVLTVIGTVVAAGLLTISDQPYPAWSGSSGGPALTRSVTATRAPETPTPTLSADGNPPPALPVETREPAGPATPTPTNGPRPTVISAFGADP